MSLIKRMMDVNYLSCVVLCSSMRTKTKFPHFEIVADVNILLFVHSGIVPSMVVQGGGHIVNVSSLNAWLPTPNRAAYSASKSALQGFSDSLRAEHAGHGIDVTVVSPGYVDTEMSSNALAGNGERIGGDAATANWRMIPFISQCSLKF